MSVIHGMERGACPSYLFVRRDAHEYNIYKTYHVYYVWVFIYYTACACEYDIIRSIIHRIVKNN